MSNAAEALRNGDISALTTAATAAVKTAPMDAGARWLLAEALLVTGELERADRVLDAAVLEEPNPAIFEFRSLLRAEEVRSQVLRNGRAPKYQGDNATAAQIAAMRARMLLRLGDAAGASEAAAQAEALRPPVSGRIELSGGEATTFADLRDADDTFTAEFELLTTAGEYMLVPVERVASLVFDAPVRLRDLIWRRCAIELKDGTEGIVYLPALYMGLTGETVDAFRLGRSTEWTDPGDGPVRGRGQRILIAGEEAPSFIEIAKLVLD